MDDIKRKRLRKVLKTAARNVRLEVKGKKEMKQLCSVQSTHIHWHLWVTKGCSSYCHPGFILLVLHTGFRFTERLHREIQLSMVGSCRTWNKDEPGLGRPKALPSSVPCRVAVIWKVLSGRRMSVNVHLYTSYCTQWHGHAPPSQIHHTPTVQLVHIHPWWHHLTPPHPHPMTTTTSSILFNPLLSPGPLWKLDMLLNVLCVYRWSDSCSCYISMHAWMWIYCLPLSLCTSICVIWWPCMWSTHIQVLHMHQWLLLFSAFCPVLLSGHPYLLRLFIWGQYILSCSWKENGS